MPRIGLILALLLGLGATPFAFHALRNNHRLNKLEDRFLALKPPPRSELIFRFSKLGLLHRGSGVSCSYVVGEVRSAPGDLGPVLASYGGYAIEGAAVKNGPSPDRCEIKAQALSPDFEQSGAESLGFHDEQIMAKLSALAKKRADLYLVVCADIQYPAGFDPRCRLGL